MTIREAQTEGAGILAGSRVDAPSLDASLLLAFAVGMDRARLLASYPEEIGPETLSRYRDLLARRESGDCVAYIVGSKEFRGLDFSVTPDVLVPRPDTETLVEAALEWIDDQARASGRKRLSTLDVCTGSGCVAIALKAERPELAVSAVDLSAPALELARKNAYRLLGETRGEEPVAFFLGDLTAPVPGSFDLIVSNPPYIPSYAIDRLSPEVRKEPRLALDGGGDGLDVIRRLVGETFAKLRSGGRLLMEIGHDQTASVGRLLSSVGYCDVDSYPDLSGIERVMGATKP